MKPYAATGGKPTFHEFITPIGLIVHLYHDKPQLKTKDQHGRIPDIDENGIQRAEFKATIAWSKTRTAELSELINLANQVKLEGWPESGNPQAFFALEPFFRDGDNPAHNTKGREYLRGRYYLNFKQPAKASRDKMTGQVIYEGGPGLLGPYGPEDKIMPVDIYPGCTGRVSGVMFATEYMGKHFISTRLNNIQKYEDGERIGGGARPTPESQFDALKQGSPGLRGGMGSLLGGAGGPPLGGFPQPSQGFQQPQGGSYPPQDYSAGGDLGGGFTPPPGSRII
jgi:hypothetical protein